MNIKFFKKEHSVKKKEEEFNPYFFWSFIFYTGLLLTAFFFLFGFYLWTLVNKDPVLIPTEINYDRTVNKDRLGKALDYFKVRQTKSNQIINSPAPIVDPSL